MKGNQKKKKVVRSRRKYVRISKQKTTKIKKNKDNAANKNKRKNRANTKPDTTGEVNPKYKTPRAAYIDYLAGVISTYPLNKRGDLLEAFDGREPSDFETTRFVDFNHEQLFDYWGDPVEYGDLADGQDYYDVDENLVISGEYENSGEYDFDDDDQSDSDEDEEDDELEEYSDDV